VRVGVIGINHKLANLELRELLAKACQRCFVGGSSVNSNHTCVLLTTCNRTEIYFTSHDLAETHSYLLQLLRCEVDDEFDQKVYSYFGHDCFLHLARVTAGLDSAIVAETEIQGQVKAAYEKSISSITLPNELHFLFQKSLKVGKQVRSELSMGRGMPDLEHAIFNAGIHLFENIQQPKILFVGASDVNSKILAFLKSKNLQNITLCNRTPQRAKVIAETYNLSLLEWSNLSSWHNYQWVIFGTKAPHYLITKTDLPSCCNSQKLIIDLSVPRNVEPKLSQDPRITLLNIDQINRILRVRKQKMAHTLVKAENLIATAAKRHMESFLEKERYRNYYQVNA
jgi:glutamyl-tRNA reductase